MRQITRPAFEKFQEELQTLKNKRREIAEKIERAKELGDLSENAEYQMAREEQAFTEGRILEIEAILREAAVVEDYQRNGVVSLGSKILIECGEKKFSYEIVSFSEANPASGKISNESPIGRALFGRKEGDAVEIHVPAGMMKCVILKVE